MKYSKYTTSEFVEDPYFRKWVQNPNDASNAFWESFREKHPGKIQEVTNARNLLLAVKNQVESDFSNKSNEDAVFQRIREQAGLEQKTPVRRLASWPAWAAAASVIFLMGWWFLNKQSASQLSYETNLEHAEVALIEKVNNTDQPMVITLEDSSTVFLKPDSKISFAVTFNTSAKREVYLSGEAFFEVTKNPDKPFYVYANELVTRVLGTSFNVRAFKDDKNVTVKVSTGRVSVAVAKAITDAKNAPSSDGVLLLPNQQAVLSRQDIKLVKSLVEEPGSLAGKNRKPLDERFVFEAAPAAEVFKTLEEAYGLHIEFDDALFNNCQFTANLTEESLYNKLDIICKSIEATYQIVDARIIVSGKGCG
ncbi:FecR family protein [Dyadobacter pollutisoli]|uniref:FecR domain-containing protein n=1 Tax=Dyadobacter pollutisoli TaxID=2910158 RepID=A0A9E8NG71_9BACT|nr:FecR family protein [Dyadobacter pollutisoli]WAC14713.1 FecR domain-containing protein [Dyadobacter pollutisoli]